ncbi:hypothetical protein JTE90_018389 [Oedothorax gibbosus]|uniref:Small subunit processome component 20 homolog n=1 Tax=Oedothorax gibbosus TaxID=931172 RepID=A0AAV6U9T8_9ARAC|nr:hypothetical protein JTE90_018389 [Oedothorax gibbosus]
MKPKPVSHKQSNTFKFQTFAKQLENIDVSIFRRELPPSPDGKNSHFWEAFEKWRDLDYSNDFEEFRKDIGEEIVILDQVVHWKNKIAEVLLKYLGKEESLAIPAILELTIAFARDLQEDFYKDYFTEFFSVITSQFKTKETDLLEKLFVCLAYLFKFLWKNMVKDFERVYSLFSSLLSNTNKEYIRTFACLSFAFLLRKVFASRSTHVHAKTEKVIFIFKELQRNSTQTSGVGQLWFEVMKGVKEQFHSCIEKVFEMLLKLLGNEELSPDLIEESLVQTVTSMASHTTQKQCVVVQNIFCKVLTELLNSIETGDSNDFKIKHLDRLLHLLLLWIQFKDGKLITSENALMEVLVKVCSLKHLPEYCMKSVVALTSSVMLTSCVDIPIDKLNLIISQIFRHSDEISIIFTRSMFDYGMFEKDILPTFFSSCLTMFNDKDESRKYKALEILSETVTVLKPVIATGEDIKSFTKLYLNVPPSKEKTTVSYDVVENFLVLILQDLPREDNLSHIWSALVCLPHVRFLKVEKACTVLKELAEKIRSVLLTKDSSQKHQVEEFGFVLCQVYFTMLILDSEGMQEHFSLNFFADILKKHPSCISILRVVDYYASSLNSIPVIEEDLLSILIPNLASPYHLVRFFTLRILKMLGSQQLQPPNGGKSIFEICLEAEIVPLEVQSYRDKLKWMRKLEYSFIENDLPSGFEQQLIKASLYYLLGMLYVNFKLLWDPTLDIIQSFAHGTTNLFWEVFSPHLNSAIEICEKSKMEVNAANMSKWDAEDAGAYYQNLKTFCQPTESPDVFNHRLLLWKGMELFPDVVEAKNRIIVPLLFQFMVNEIAKTDPLMASAEAVGESQDSVSPLDVEEIEEESNHVGKKSKRKRKAKIESITKRSKLDTSEAVDSMEIDTDLDVTTEGIVEKEDISDSEEESDEDIEEVEDLDNSVVEDLDNSVVEKSKKDGLDTSVVKKSKKKQFAARRFYVAKTLCGYLSVFSKFKNPKGGFKTDELQKLYCELLSSHDPIIQKLAFECVLTFKYKYLTPYKDNFYRILENKTFKTEVVLFSLDSENKVIQEEHRMDVLAILMRILYGKMLYKTGGNTSGKNLANARRSLVLRFLAGCKAEELNMFFELVFLPFKELMEDETHVAIMKIKNSTDLSNIVPVRKQHSALNTLGLIFQHLGNLVPELLPYLLKVLLIIAATSTTILEKDKENKALLEKEKKEKYLLEKETGVKDTSENEKEKILPLCVITLLKSVRTLAIMKLIQFFKTFQDYKFTADEIDAIFHSIVWPMLDGLALESVNHPSPLLRLFATWSDNARFFILFAKHHEQNMSLTPLKNIMDLYCNKLSKARVVGVISKIIFELLTAEDRYDEDSTKSFDITINCCLTLPDITIDNIPSHLGNKLIQPYVDKVLCRFEMTVSSLAKRKFKSLPTRDLKILLSISKFVEDGAQCFKLIQLLPQFLSKPKVDSESEVLILTTISYLLRKSENPDYFIKLFAPMFGKLGNQNSRTALVKVFCTIAEIKPEMRELTEIVTKANAYDPNSLGEPDYQLRLDAHKETLKKVEAEQSFNEDFIRIVIFNSSYMIRVCDDIALRSSSSNMLQKLSKILYAKISHSTDLTRLLLYETLLPEIQKGLKNPNEAVRHEFISILSAILHSWKDENGLKELAMLQDENEDLDFWENIRHLQVHRRARALLRFSDTLKEQCKGTEKVSVQYLLSYMIPIVSSFLFDAAYKKHVHVIDAAIETLGSIALALPWHHYEGLLKRFLQQLSTDVENHKTVIKIIVSLLNSFHFKPVDNKDTASTDMQNNELGETLTIEDAEMQTIDQDNSVAGPAWNETTQGESYKIYHAIKKNIMPLLHRALMRKTKRDDEHKLSGHYYPEDEDILRVPIALAMVKLLQKLPAESLKKNLPRLFLKMCDLLKSKTESIRETTRETLIKMMESLGPKHFRGLLSEMRGVLKRGYQVHVLTYTLNSILTRIAGQMEPGALDDCLKDLTEICMTELFSDMAEEKEVSKITGKLKEARCVKSYYIFEILSKFVSKSFLLDLIKPLKEALGNKQSHKVMKKVTECLRHIAIGLSDNKSVVTEKQLLFIHAIINESMSGLNKKKVEIAKPKFERPDCFLIPKEPGRSGPPAKINERTTDHVFVEFGLLLFSYYLKKDKIDKENKKNLEMLDPFIPILSDFLSSNHIKIITSSLRCLLPLYKYNLPSFKTATKKIVDSLFILINKYAAVGMGQGENFEMIVMSFKVFTVLVRDTTYLTLSEDQLKSLLSYIEQDIYDYTRQATAFTLLKAILSKKLQADEMKGIMSKIAEMAITSEKDYVRAQCRQTCLQYMLDYPLGKQLIKSLSFFIAQLEYEYKDGRVSALEIIDSMLTHFQEHVLQKHSALFLVPLAARLVNDESSNCREMAAKCIKKLLTKVQHDGRLGLFSIALTWLQAKKLSHKRLGAQLCGLFAEVEEEQFEHHLHEVLPVVTSLMCAANTEEVKSAADERSTDHFLFHVLNSVIKMLKCCPVIKKPEFSESLNLLWTELQKLILYPHLWVRLGTSQLFGLLLSTYTVEEIQEAINRKKKKKLVFLNSRQKLRDLTADFATQLQSLKKEPNSEKLNEKLGDQVIRNLVYLARVISILPEKTYNNNSSSKEDNVEVTLNWIIRKLCREAKKEVAEDKTFTQKRMCVFNFMAAFAHALGKEKVMPHLRSMLIPLCREISDGSVTDEELKKYAQERLDLIKAIVGVEDFSEVYADIQTSLSKKKAERKREKKQEAVTNPQARALKRIKKQLSKKDSKKRKIAKLRVKKKVKKPKFSDLVIAT